MNGVFAILKGVWTAAPVLILGAMLFAPTIVTSLMWSWDSVGTWVAVTTLSLIVVFCLGVQYAGVFDSRGRWIHWKWDTPEHKAKRETKKQERKDIYTKMNRFNQRKDKIPPPTMGQF